MQKFLTWVKNHKPHTIGITVVLMAVIVLSILAISEVFRPGVKEPLDPEKSTLDLSIIFDENWTEDSSPIIVHIKGVDENTKEIDFYHAIMPLKDQRNVADSVEVLSGAYEISTISPVNYDGSIFKMNETITIDTNDTNSKSPSAEFVLEHIKAEDTTDEQLKNILNQTQIAIENGDESLKGDTGEKILIKLKENISNNSNTSSETKQELSDTNTEETATTNSTSSQTTATDNNSAGTNSDIDSSHRTTSASMSSSSGNTNSTSSGATANTHTHNWKERKVWVSNIVTVVDEPEHVVYGAQLYTKQADGTWLSNGETYWFENGFTIDDLKAIIKDKMINEGYIGNYVNREKTIPAVTHTEDHGSYQISYYCECGATKK